MPRTPDVRDAHLELVFDTTVLSNFSAVGQCSLLDLHYRGRAYTTLMVVEELQRGLEAGYEHLRHAIALTSLQPSGWLPVLVLESTREQALYAELSAALETGEAACLAVAVARGLTLATDDLAARRLASQRGVRLTGTLGILTRLVRQGHVSLVSANEILRGMILLGYRAPVERLDGLI